MRPHTQVYYMAPEVIKKKYNQKCDIWSLGVILYIMLTGRPPFVAPSDAEIYELILKGEVPFPEEKWTKISPPAKDLVQKMLAYDPAARITAKDALSHPWIR
jgi:calcium-dependent protein kinase